MHTSWYIPECNGIKIWLQRLNRLFVSPSPKFQFGKLKVEYRSNFPLEYSTGLQLIYFQLLNADMSTQSCPVIIEIKIWTLLLFKRVDELNWLDIFRHRWQQHSLQMTFGFNLLYINGQGYLELLCICWTNIPLHHNIHFPQRSCGQIHL